MLRNIFDLLRSGFRCGEAQPQETQRQRILQRPAFLHQRFFDVWIPMENAYFAALDSALGSPEA